MRNIEYTKGIVLKDMFPWMRTYDERMVIALVKIYKAITIYTIEEKTPKDIYYFEIGDRSEYIYEDDNLRLIGVVTNHMLNYLNIGCMVKSDSRRSYMQYRTLYTNIRFNLLKDSIRGSSKRDNSLRLLSIVRHKDNFNALIENYNKIDIPIGKQLQFISEDGEIVANGKIIRADSNTYQKLRYVQLKFNPWEYKKNITYVDYENTIIKEVEVQNSNA